MKKILLLFSLILAFFTSAQVNYSQDWTATGLSNWTSTSSVFTRNATAGQICGTTGGTIRGNRYSGNAGDFTSPNIPGNNQGLVTMSFDYKITDWSAGTVATPAATIGTIAVQYSNNVGGPWVTAYTVNSTNHVTANTCVTRTVTFSPLAGNLFVRFYVTSGTNDSYYYFDNVVMTQGAAPSCLAPYNIALVNVTATNANISWTAPTPAPANGYDVYYNTTGIAPVAGTVLNATNSVQSTTTTATISGLTPITTYYVWVRAKCSSTDLSTWTPMQSFMTLCVPVSVLPWTENFDSMTTLGAGILPPCWKNVTGTSAWTSSNAAFSTTSPGPRSTPNYVRIQYGNTNASQLWTPGFALTAGVNYEFSFYYHTGGTGTSLIGYTGNVLVNTSQSTAGATNLGAYITATQGTSAYTQYKVYYTPTTSGTYNFGVNTSSNFTPWYLGVDDFKLRIAPTCLDPQGFSVANVTTSSATVQWTVPTPAPAGGYDIYYTTSSAIPAPGVTPQYTGVTGPTQLINGLAASTTYYIWIRARCSSTDIGDWTGPLSIYTNYCVPTGGSSSTTYYLKNITTTNGFTNLNYAATTYSAYVNNSATSFSVLPGNSVDVTMNGGSTSSYYYIWIDWNNDMVFTPGTGPGGEEVYWSGGYVPNGSTTISSVGRPAGSYRARFATSWSGTLTPCGAANYGNYVDFTFIIKPCSTVAPTNVTVNTITHNSAVVNWTASPDNLNYRVYWKELTSATWTNSSVILAPPTTSYTINTGLQPATNYEVKVVAICNGTEGTAPSIPFVTKCDPAPPTVTISNITPNSAVVTWNPLVASAVYTIRWRKVGSGVAGWQSPPAPGTPQPPLNSYTITGLDSFENYEVQVSTTCVGASVANPWSNPEVFTTIRVCEIPPPGLTITQLTPTTAEVIWDAYTGAGATNSYVLRYRKVGIPSWTTVNVNTNTYTITGLLELTKYEMQVANVCTGTSGNFTPLYYFTTPTVVYCQMGSTNFASEFISKVTVTPTGKPQMANTTAGSQYSDYTGTPTKFIEMIQGSTGNQIVVDKKLGSGVKGGVAVWIDFNRNGTFDLNERILADGPNESTTASATFNVPADAFVSMTDYKYVVMRVAMSKDAIPVNCTSFANGEVEDYTVRISKLPVANALNQTDIMIYPNPVKSTLNVKNISKKANYKIYSASGQLISSGIILNNKIDVSRLINGVYMIDIDDVQGTAQKKFIKE
ncbi:fibronectin type III domain-containing protein [Chryseobacterium luquanense]|uniref:Fibronectin type III domain-containing protein n=1 Tax=Chryseobacterium luquanense TaxID=2983766 RepID=A0ABT3Y6K4_9FLAO|nr:fibronectin type III domain-containing protein [Chryseobacterium luquanense]MCX8533787.1 fibronectin type III domain-containing protein [Chryseobacterium luquanense]